MSLIQQLLAKEWFVDTLGMIILVSLVVALIIFVMRQVGLHLHEFMKFFGQEGKDLLAARPTLGAVNFLCLLVVVFFGVLSVVALKFAEIMEFIVKFLGLEKAESLKHSVDIQMLFYVIAAISVTSILAVAFSSKK